MRKITKQTARRLAVTKQRLDGNRPADILEVMRSIRCLQLDPIRAVERTQLVVLWSRLGMFDPAGLDHLVFEEKSLFEYWAHAASIVLTEDYPIHSYHMREYASGERWRAKTKAWLEENKAVREQVLDKLEKEGALPAGAFESNEVKEWQSTGWTDRRTVSQLLDLLWTEGTVMVARRESGRKRFWDLSDRCLPDWTPRQELNAYELTAQAVQWAVKGLGVGTVKQIKKHFTRGGYPEIKAVVPDLIESGLLLPVRVEGFEDDWFIHAGDMPTLNKIEAGDWQPRTVLLSPFDNLICDRDRTEALWDFYFRIEIYVPKAKRQYGYYVLPILHGEELIGRIDPKMDRKTGKLHVYNVYQEPNCEWTKAIIREIKDSIEELAEFLGAREVVYGVVPAGW